MTDEPSRWAVSCQGWPLLQVRIEQVLASTPQLLVCFRLSQLLGFYTETVVQLAGPGAALVATLQTAQVRCLLSYELPDNCLPEHVHSSRSTVVARCAKQTPTSKVPSAGSSNPRLQGRTLTAGREAGAASTAPAVRPVTTPTGAAYVGTHRQHFASGPSVLTSCKALQSRP